MADQIQPESFASPKEPEPSSAEVGGYQHVRPVVNWNAGGARTIRTSLRGSRTLSNSQPVENVPTNPHSTTLETPLNDTSSPEISIPAVPSSIDPPPMSIQATTFKMSDNNMSDSRITPTSHAKAPLVVNTQATTFQPPGISMSGTESSATSPVDIQYASPQQVVAIPTSVDGTSLATAEGRRLRLGNLPYNVTVGDIEEFFSGVPLENIDLPVNPRTGRTLADAFVDVPSASEAQEMVPRFSGQPIKNRKISIQIARPRKLNPAASPTAVDYSAPIYEKFKAGKPEEVSWSELIARAKRSLDDAKGELEKAALPNPSGNGLVSRTQEAVQTKEDLHDDKIGIPTKLRSLSLQDSQQRPNLESQSRTQLESNSAIGLSSDEDDNGATLNLNSPQGQRSEEGEFPKAPASKPTNTLNQVPVQAATGTKRGFDSIEDTAERVVESSESDEDRNDEMDSDNDDDEEEEYDDENEDHDKESNDESQENQDASEEGEIAEGSESDDDAMVTEYSNADQSPRGLQNDNGPEIVEVESVPSTATSRESSPIPGIISGDGPKILQDLSPSQLRIQVRYFYVGRDLYTIPESDPVRCTICAKPGHVKKYCPSATCVLCGESGTHFAHSCPKNPRCSRCRGHHDISACTLKLKPDNLRLTCDWCQEDGHEEGDCELRWRSSGPIWKIPLPPLSVPRYCYECGQAGHLGNDCRRRRPGKPMGSSMWSESGLPNPVQPIKNIVPGQMPPPRPRQKGPPPNKKNKFDKHKKARTGSVNDPINLDDSGDEWNDLPRLKRGPPKKMGKYNASVPMRFAPISGQGGNRYNNVPPPSQYQHPGHGFPPRPEPGNAGFSNYGERQYRRDNYRTMDGARRRSRSPPRMTRPHPGNEPFSRGGQTYRPAQQEISIRGRADRMRGR